MAGTTGKHYPDPYHVVYQQVTKTENQTVLKVYVIYKLSILDMHVIYNHGLQINELLKPPILLKNTDLFMNSTGDAEYMLSSFFSNC